MTPEELRLDEAKRWLEQAGKDLNAARILAPAEPSRSAFHSQQAAEKAAKGFLAFHNAPFRKTHDLEELGKQCVALNPSLTGVFAKAESLTDYAVVFRYLEAPHEPDEAEAAEALEIASRLYREVRKLLALEWEL
jgi:HEPN domain-containing protein